MTIADTATEQVQELLPVTRTIIEGPYFRIGAPERASLIEPGITGDRMMLTGRVLTPEGKPIPGAVLNFWMSDDEERLKDNYYPDLDVQVRDNPDGNGFIGELDFVIAQVTEKENVTAESLAARVK